MKIEQHLARISQERLSIRSTPFVLTKELQVPGYTTSDNGAPNLKGIEESELLDWISTDQIIPSVWCMQYSDPENLGRYLLTGIRGIRTGDMQNSGANT